MTTDTITIPTINSLRLFRGEIVTVRAVRVHAEGVVVDVTDAGGKHFMVVAGSLRPVR